MSIEVVSDEQFRLWRKSMEQEHGLKPEDMGLFVALVMPDGQVRGIEAVVSQ